MQEIQSEEKEGEHGQRRHDGIEKHGGQREKWQQNVRKKHRDLMGACSFQHSDDADFRCQMNRGMSIPVAIIVILIVIS